MKKHSLILLLVAVLLSGIGFSCRFSRNEAITKSQGISSGVPGNLYPPADLVIPTHNDWTRGNYPKTIAEFKTQPLQQHDIVLLGNSITRQGRDWGKRLNNPTIKNRGIAGDVTDGVLERLGEIIYVQPKAVFIEIGINDLFNDTLSPARTAQNIIKIAGVLRRQSPKTKIYVQTIFPTDKPQMVNRIKETNEILRNYKKRNAFTLIDTYALFADEKDLMKKEYTNDGVHLTEKGYEVWVAHLKKYL